jgi:CheY-like chemotaxis protein
MMESAGRVFKGMTEMHAVLVVDDEPLVAETLADCLEGPDVDVYSATNAGKAMDLVRNRPIEVLVTDIRMPGTDGFELARLAKHLRPDLRVIFVTGYFPSQMKPHDIPGPILFKPLASQSLQSAVKSALRPA